MAQDDVLGGLSDANQLLKFGDWLMKAKGGASVGTGGLLPGGITAYQGPGMGAAVSTGSSLGAAMPFLGLAGFNLSKIIGSALADKPKISFSGTDPSIGYNGNFGTYHEGQYKAPPGGSKKYNYRIGVEDTGQDGEIGQALVNYFDSVFDQLAAQGVPVNEMLDRNKEFLFGGRLDKATSPESLVSDIMNHFQPDIDAYQSGQQPPERQITVKASQNDPIKGRDNYEAGKNKTQFTYTIGNKETGPSSESGGTLLGGGDMPVNPNNPYDPNNPGSLANRNTGNSNPFATMYSQGGNTQNTSGNVSSGIDRTVLFDKDLYLQNKLAEWKANHPDAPERTVEDIAAAIQKLYPDSANPYEQHFMDYGKTEGVSPFEGISELDRLANASPPDAGADGWKLTPTNYQYDQNTPEIFEDYVNSFYDQALKETRKQAGQFEDNTNEYSEKSQGLLSQGQGYLDKLINEVEGNNTRNLPTVSRMAGGQRVDWVPKPNRDAALQDTNSALGLFDKQGGFLDMGLGEAKQDYANKQVLASAGNPTLNYLDKLKELVAMEYSKQAGDKGLTLDRDQLNAQVEGSEPGILDYAMGIGNLASGVGNFVKSNPFGLFG